MTAPYVLRARIREAAMRDPVVQADKPFACGNCGLRFGTKGEKRRHKQGCDATAPVMPQDREPVASFMPDADHCEDEDLYGFRLKRPRWMIEDANRQWDAIPTNPAELSLWMKGEPINPVQLRGETNTIKPE